MQQRRGRRIKVSSRVRPEIAFKVASKVAPLPTAIRRGESFT